MDESVGVMEEADYDPYEQLTGYLQTGEEYYITRRGAPGRRLGRWIRKKSKLI